MAKEVASQKTRRQSKPAQSRPVLPTAAAIRGRQVMQYRQPQWAMDREGGSQRRQQFGALSPPLLREVAAMLTRLIACGQWDQAIEVVRHCSQSVPLEDAQTLVNRLEIHLRAGEFAIAENVLRDQQRERAAAVDFSQLSVDELSGVPVTMFRQIHPRALEALQAAGIDTLGALLGTSEAALLQLPGFGVGFVTEVVEAMAAYGWELSPTGLGDGD